MAIFLSIVGVLCALAVAKLVASDRFTKKRIYIRTKDSRSIDISKLSEYSGENITKILFIGNSYVYFNDMPDILKWFAEDTGKEVVVGSYAVGGYRLIDHIDSDDEHSRKLKEILCYDWDVLVLQEQSVAPIIDVENFHRGAEKIVELIDRDKTRVLLYSTWPRKTDAIAMDDLEISKQEMLSGLKNGYMALAKNIGAEICPVGDAFNLAEERNNKINLYWLDGSHPSYRGSYLSACVMYGVIFDELCVGLEQYGHIFGKYKKLLQECADETVSGRSGR